MRRLLPLLCGLLALFACGETKAPPEEARSIDEPALAPSPPPGSPPREELERLPPRGRRRIEGRLNALEAAPNGAAWGDLALDLHALLLLDTAAVAYEHAALGDPENVRWPYLAGYLAYQQRRREDALVMMERALDLEPANTGALYWKARILFELQRFDDAHDTLKELSTRRGAYTAAIALEGHMASAEGRWGDAVVHYRKALEAQPEATELHYPLAQALRHLGRDEEAEALEPGERKVIREDPHFELLLLRTRHRRMEMAQLAQGPDPRLAEGRELALEGRWQEAQVAFEEALTDADGGEAEAMARFGLGMVALQGHGDCLSALQELGRVTELRPGLSEAWLGSVECLGRLARWQEAETTLRQGLESNPGATALQERLIRLLAAAQDDTVRDGAEAHRLAVELVEKEPSGENYEALAMALAEEGEWEQAVDIQKQVLEIARSGGRPDLLPFLEENLRNYSQQRPCRKPWPAPPSLVRRSP